MTCNFTPGSARLSNICKAKLDDAALKMKQDPAATAQVIGYADSSERQGQRISDQRAQNVKSYLVTRHGIDPTRIKTEGRDGQDATSDKAENRRAVVIITTTTQ